MGGRTVVSRVLGSTRFKMTDDIYPSGVLAYQIADGLAQDVCAMEEWRVVSVNAAYRSPSYTRAFPTSASGSARRAY